MKKHFHSCLRLLLISLLFYSSSSSAHQVPEPVFARDNAYAKIQNTIDLLIHWAESEYALHASTGLWKQFPEEGKVMMATIATAQELKKKAETFKAGKNDISAQAHYFAAEAVARYAAQMPHILEGRPAPYHHAPEE